MKIWKWLYYFVRKTQREELNDQSIPDYGIHDKTNEMNVRTAKTQISLGICPVWSESSLCAQWVAKDPSFLHADSEDSDQTGAQPHCWFCRVTAQIDIILFFLPQESQTKCNRSYEELMHYQKTWTV